MTTLYCILAVIPFVIGLVKREFKSQYLNPFMYFLLYSVITELALTFSGSFGIRNIWMVNVWLLVQCAFLLLFFSKIFLDKFSLKWLILGTAPALILFTLQYSTINMLNTELQAYVHLLVVILSCTFLVRIMSRAEISPFRLPLFWICAGLIVFFLGTILVFSIYSLFEVSEQKWLGDLFHGITLSILLISNAFYSFGLLCSSKNMKYKFSSS